MISARTMYRRALTAMLVTGIAGAAHAQTPAEATVTAAPAMRSRLLTSLTGYEVSEYLKRNDTIFVPVGPTEVNGGNPTDVEYVIPLAYAMKLAEKADGLVFPYLAYFYPGGTTTSPATVYISTSESLPYLKALTRSLIRQGFRRIVFLTAHGPSGNTMLPLVRETYDELHVPVLWMSTSLVGPPGSGARGPASAPPPATGQKPPAAAGQPPADGMGGNFRQLAYGAYQIVGRLNDMPVGLSQPRHDFPKDPGNLSRFVPPYNGTPAGSFYADPSEHGGWVMPVSAAQRAEWGQKGADYISAQVAAFDVNGALDALRKRDQFTRELEKKYGTLLPGSPR
ncbi:creatininase family protein [Sphingomonas floccifaciens]|uniref:Creatininase family protein n=1 Tax=Sphingomonas floccifaciens TaxID=1844115 RepID=A0ABW4NBT8_9SPHN